MQVTIVDAVEHTFSSGLTTHPIDNKRAVMALRAATTLAEHQEIMRLIMEKRDVHRRWLTITQRHWQAHRRTVTPRSCKIRQKRWGNRHDDATILRAERESVSMREKYVRCAR